GVHPATWFAPEMTAIYDKHLGSDWRSRVQDPATWAGMERASDEELWSARSACRERFVSYVRTMAGYGRTAGATGELRADQLIIGFARRFAGYKRGTLLLRDPDRLGALL